MSKNKFILEMHNINKKFEDLSANDNITFKVRQGTVHALIGENGAGKSTLMNMLAGIQSPDSGRICIHGEIVNFKNPLDSVRHGIGMLCQEFMIFPGMTVLENIIMGFEQKKGIFIDYKESGKKVEEICKKYKFNIPINAKVDELSIAALQQVEIIKILYRNADIIILDEPTSVLTPQGVVSLFDAIKFLVIQGKTIIFITHKLKEVLEIADDVTVLKDGQVTGTLSARYTNELELARLMVGREVILQVEKPENKIGDTILEIEDLSIKDSSGVIRVKNVSFNVHAGEIVGVSGVAGSGQTELAEAIVGLSNYNKDGKISFYGENVIDGTIAEKRKMGMGYVAQDRTFVGTNRDGSIWENTIMGYHRAKGFRTKHLLDYRDINIFTSKVVNNYAVKIQGVEDKVNTLSGGNVQKLLVGREFLQEQRLLIVENPTRGIDIGSVEFIWEKIIEMAGEGVGILLISYELNEVIQLSDRILVMYNGTIIEHRDSKRLTEEQLGLMMLSGEICEI